MCVIAVCENETRLTKEVFSKCFDHNDNGAGFAWLSDGRVNFAKGYMDEKIAWRVYTKINMFPHIAHFRLASAGEKCPELTHPFLITEDSELKMNGSGKESVLFHNGTIIDWKILNYMVALKRGKSAEGVLSDSRVMAMIVSMIGDSNLALDSGKFVIASTDGFKRFGSTVAGKDSWDLEDGIYFSNLYFKHTYTVVGGWYDNKSVSSYYQNKNGVIVHETQKQESLPYQLKGVNMGNGRRLYEL